MCVSCILAGDEEGDGAGGEEGEEDEDLEGGADEVIHTHV